jgi:beta-alanine degradation protein BauB
MAVHDPISDGIGTELLFENDRVRVWDLRLQPGEASPTHRHRGDYLFVQVTPSTVEAHEGGEAPSLTECDDGFVQYTEVGPGIVHRIVNRADLPFREILVEFKGPSRVAAPREPQTNGRSRAVDRR